MNENRIRDISQSEKKIYISNLAGELPALRAMLGLSQEELGKLAGISRQTYSMIETQKKEMSWSVYLSLIFIFSSNDKTRRLLDYSNAYPEELLILLKNEDIGQR